MTTSSDDTQPGFCRVCHGRGTWTGTSRFGVPESGTCSPCKGTGKGDITARALVEALVAPAVLTALLEEQSTCASTT